jgi:hypothetical protein
MKQLVFGLYAEGSTDIRYFRVLLQRFLTRLFVLQGINTEILDPVDLPKSRGSFIAQMQVLEKNYTGLGAIFVHIDADSKSMETVLQYKWNPWLLQCNDKRFIPVIPIKMLESWMLADQAALAKILIVAPSVVSTTLDNVHPEAIPDPKGVLRELASKGKTRSRLGFEGPLAKETDFAALERLPSFQHFAQVTSDCLIPWARD